MTSRQISAAAQMSRLDAAEALAVYADHCHCACGSSFAVTCDNPEVVADLLGIWRTVHADAPHRPATARQAAQARRRPKAMVRAAAEVGW